ncbi:MAG: GNAT family N-acetyltransferase [Chloroflexi bacterium]|nr:GNAT family N-acetyltransferase [Chloroflexota bacterium]
MNLEYRKLTPVEINLADELDRVVQGRPPVPDWVEYWGKTAWEYDRSVVAFDGDQLVGQAMSYSHAISVPGGAIVPCGGLSWVAVRPTHRRRGIMREIVQRQLRDYHDRGEPLAALFAEEAPIYGRFGWGVATWIDDLKIDSSRAELKEGVGVDGEIRFVDYDDAVSEFSPVHKQAMLQTPGMLARSEPFWVSRLRGNESPPGAPLKTLQVGCYFDGQCEGFASYRNDEQWEDGNPSGTVYIRDLVSSTPRASARLWRYFLEIDLMRTVEIARPPDEPIHWWLKDRRVVTRTISDGLYIRLVNVQEALAAAAYGADDSIAIEVIDDSCEWNTGTYLLDSGDAGSICDRTSREPDVTLRIEDLGSLYLGGVSAHSLHAGGRIEDHSGDGVARLQRLFESNVAPWPHLYY